MQRRDARWMVVVGLIATMVGGPMAAAQDRFPRLADWRLLIGDAASLWGLRPDGDGPDAPARDGRWTVTAEPMVDGHMVVHVSLEPPVVSLPVEPGPALLVTATALGGGVGGDVGYERLVSLDTLALPACPNDPCTFTAEVTVDLRKLPRIARREPELETAWASIGFTVIRTFGGGTWLQALASDRRNGTIFSGTPGTPEPWLGDAYPAGVFPADGVTAWREDDGPTFDIQALLLDARTSMVDTSQPPAATDVRFVATFERCRDPFAASLRTAAGDQVTALRAADRDFVDATWSLPRGTRWQVGWTATALTFDVAESPLLVTARYRCSREGVSVEDVAIGEVVATGP